MLAHRIIPVMLQRGDALVKGKQFNSWRTVGHAEQAVRIHQARGVDELIYLDIGATPSGRGPDFEMVKKLTAECFMPITVGGGVRSIEDVRGLLEAGADKVAIRTHRAIIGPVSKVVGCQAIVASLDVWEMNDMVPTKLSEKGRTILRGLACQHAQEVAEAGAGEILLTSVDREGMMDGYDLELIDAVSRSVDVPVIAHGGCGTYRHMAEAIRAGAMAVAAGSMFQFTNQTPRGAAKYLAEQGIEVRL